MTPSQPGMFGPTVGAASPSDAVAALGARLPERLHLGTSSWSFPGWTGLVWDAPHDKGRLAREGLGAYARHPVLGAVGVDRTYYGPVAAQVFADWRGQVPAAFRFLVKAHDHVTTARFPRHPRYGERAGQDNPRFLDPAYATEAVVGPAVEGLGDTLGVLLFQLPPTDPRLLGPPEALADRLDAFLGALPRGPRYGVEIRTPAWLTPAYAQALVAHEAVHSYVAHPAMPPIAEQIRAVRGGARHGLVVRWMLQRGLDYEGAKARFAPFRQLAAPDPGTRGDIARLCRLALGRDKDVIVIVNNKAEGSAPLSCIGLAEAIVDGGQPNSEG